MVVLTSSLTVCLVPGPSGLGWFHPLFWDGSNPSHVWLIVLGWVGSIPFFCLVGGIGKKGQMVYLTPFATVLMGPTCQGHTLSSSSPQRIRPARAASARGRACRSPSTPRISAAPARGRARR